MVDVLVRAVMLEVCRPQEAHNRLGWVEGEHTIVSHANDGRISVHNLIWVQTTLPAVVMMFERVELQKNLGKTKAMVYTPGFIWVQ